MDDKLHEFLCWALRDNAEAVALCEQLVYVAHGWDDLIDGDAEVEPHRLNRIFWTALIDMPANGFYQRHYGELAPILRQSIADWLDANTLENAGRHGAQLAFVLRDSFHALAIQCAYLVGGYDWMREVSIAVRARYQDETFDQYMRGDST